MLPPFRMKLHFFPVDAASRAIWIVCQEFDIPFDLIKIEFQNSEHLTSKFTEINPNHTVPVLQDEKVILYHGHTIVRYLANKFNLIQLYPVDPVERARVDLYLDWHTTHLKKTSDSALEHVAGFSVWNFSFSSEPTVDMDKAASSIKSYVESLNYLEAYFLDKSDFICGDRVSIADIVAATEITYHRLLNADLTQFPKVLQWYERVSNSFQQWKSCNLDFDKFIVAAVEQAKKQQEQAQKIFKKGRDAKGGSKPPDICHTVYFQEPPHETFMKLTDGAYLTKTTGLNCTYTPSNAGKFSYANEQITGSNLVFVQDVMVLQSWRMSEWPQGRTCTTKFVLAAVEGGSELTLTQSDVPEQFIKKTDEWWLTNFWKPVEGVLTRNIVQQVFFENASSHEIYEMLMDSAKLAKFTKTKCEMGRGVGSEFELFDGQITGKTVELVTDAKIVQKMRFHDWPPNHHSTVTIEIKRVAGGTDLVFSQTSVPVDKYRAVVDNWEKNIWRKMQREISVK